MSKPLPASAGVLDSDPNLTLEDEMSTLKLKHSPATKKKGILKYFSDHRQLMFKNTFRNDYENKRQTRCTSSSKGFINAAAPNPC